MCKEKDYESSALNIPLMIQKLLFVHSFRNKSSTRKQGLKMAQFSRKKKVDQFAKFSIQW